MMSGTGTLNHWRLPTISASSCLFSAFSHHICASMVAISSALAAFGYLSTHSARRPSAFSGCLNQISPVVQAVKPMPWLTSCSFHGSPTQKASMLPTFMFATIWGGGTTMVAMSLSGSMPPAASRYCCKSPKLPGANFPAVKKSDRRPPIDVASITLPGSPASFSSDDEVPHIFTWKSPVQPKEILIASAKRLLQQNQPIADPEIVRAAGERHRDLHL